MYITQKEYPRLFEVHDDLSLTERKSGFQVDGALYAQFRAEADKTMAHLSPEDRTVWAIYNAHMHPGLRKDVEIPEIAEQNTAPHSTAGLPKILDAAQHLITSIETATGKVAEAVASEKSHNVSLDLPKMAHVIDPLKVGADVKADLRVSMTVVHDIPGLDYIAEALKQRMSHFKMAALVALWAIFIALLLMLCGVKLHAQVTMVRGAAKGATPANNVTVTADCVTNHNCMDVSVAQITFDPNGYLYVACPGCSGVSQFADNSAFTVGSSAINVLGAFYTSGAAPTLASGNAGRVRMDANSYLFVDCVVGCAGGSTTPTDNFANPTTAGINMSFLAGFNGKTWDLLRSDANKYLYVTIGGGNIGNTSFASTIADGADVALGSTTDTRNSSTNTTPATLMGVLKYMSYSLQYPYSGAAALTGNGVTGSGSPRVTIASDNTPFGVTNANLDTPLSGVKTDLDPLVASGGGGYVRQDSTGTIAKESGGNLASLASIVGTPGSTAPAGVSSLGGIDPWGNSQRALFSNRAPGSTDFGLVARIPEGPAILSALNNLIAAQNNVRVRGTFGVPVGSVGDAMKVITPPPADPCANKKNNVAISQAASAKLISGMAGQRIYVCYQRIVAGAAEIWSLLEGTGTTCGTATLAVSGSTTAANGESYAANGGVSAGNGMATITQTSVPGNDLCLGQNATSRLSGSIAFVYAP